VTSIKTEPKTDRPVVVRPKNVESVRALVMDDRRLTVRVITRKLCVTLSVVQSILARD
jgi:hypothetical protein